MEKGTATADEHQEAAASCATCVQGQMMMVGWCDQFSLGNGAGTAWRSRVLHPERPSSRGGVNTTEANSSSGPHATLVLSGGVSISKSPGQYVYILIAISVSLLTTAIAKKSLPAGVHSIFQYAAIHLQRDMARRRYSPVI
jgi:hypothetical protein